LQRDWSTASIVNCARSGRKSTLRTSGAGSARRTRSPDIELLLLVDNTPEAYWEITEPEIAESFPFLMQF
jgi:hypothetical protein